MTQPLARIAAFLACTLSVPSFAFAQVPAAPPALETMPIRLGPLGLAPAVAITDFGMDSNVFNEAEDPNEDFTATVVPRLRARLQMGRTSLSYSSASELVYYREYESERSANFTTDVRFDAELGRLQPYVTASWLSTKQRLNREIDIRAPRRQDSYGVGTRLLVASRTFLSFGVRDLDMRFTDGSVFRGIDLSKTLHYRTKAVDTGVELALTPLTSFHLTGTYQQDRFPRDEGRDSDSFQVLPALQFDPTALLRGRVAVGYRRFRPLAATVPAYSGFLIQTTVGYTVTERTRVELNLQRDVQYSYEDFEPYYLDTGGRVTLTQLVVGMMDVQVLGGRENLDYRSGFEASERHTDHAAIVGAGVGYRIRDNGRVSLNWEYSQRDSPLPTRRYDRRRIYATVSLGLL